MDQIRVQCVSSAQLMLQRCKLLDGILLEGNEEKSSIEFTGNRINSVGEAVPPSKDPYASILRRRSDANVGTFGNHWQPVLTDCRQVDGVMLSATPKWSTRALDPADCVLLGLEGT